MKKINIIVILLVFSMSNIVRSQVLSNQDVVNSVGNSNAFLDVSTWNNSTSNDGKGLVFPTTNLTLFTFKNNDMDGINFPSAFDGMMVYNAATGNTLVALNGDNGVVTAVVPGYYYFSNPGQTTDVTSGIWTPLSNGAVKNYSTTEVATSTSIDGAQVYAIKGSFDTLGTNALITIPRPSGMTGYYKMTTYLNGITFRTGISTFNMDPLVTNNNVVTGNGLFSEVYPLGVYTYTLEYFK